MVRQVRTGPRVIGLLGFPGDGAALDIDLPRAGARAIRAMSGADDLVMLPALAVTVFPAAIFAGGDAVRSGEGGLRGQDVPANGKMAHLLPLIREGCPTGGLCRRRVRCLAARSRAA